MNLRKFAAVLSAAALTVTCSGVTLVDAESVSFTYKSSAETAAAGSADAPATIETGYSGITLTLGADTYAYTSDKTLSGFDGRISGTANPSPSAGTGSYYSINLADSVADGELTIGYQVGADKAFYITDNGTAISDDYNGVKYSVKTTDTATFMVKGGHTYTMYASGSKAGFYGFTYRVVDKQADFENEIQGLTFDLIKGENDSADAIDCDLDLPQAYESAFGSCDVAWTSSNTSVIANNGEVSLTPNAETITITGKFSVQEDDSLVQYKTFTLTTIADNDDNAAVEAAADALTLGDVSNVKKNLDLPTVGKRATTITWATTDASVITADGVITRTPNEDTHAVLTATITRNSASATKSFTVTVKGYVPVEFIGYVYGNVDGSNSFSPVDGGALKAITFTESIQNPTGDEVFECVVYGSDGSVKGTKNVNIKNNSLGEDVQSTAAIGLEMNEDDTFIITAKSGETTLATLTPNDTVAEGAVIYVVGDSTAAVYNDSSYPRKGWAQLLGNYFSVNTVTDYALSGRSSLSFKSDTNYTTLQQSIKKGDYLIIQFGHNDSKNDDPARYTDPSTNRFTDGSYKKSLMDYVEIAENVGATPIIATSISRRKTSDASLEAYVNAARELAAELNLPLIDLYKRTNGWINEVGVEAAKDMFNYVKPYDSRFIGYAGFASSGFYATGTSDDTHINIYGADLISQWAVQEMQDQNLPIAKNINSYYPVYPLPSYEYAYDTVNGTPPADTPIPTTSPAPTAKPTIAPTEQPTEQASTAPTEQATEQATAAPTEQATEQATTAPTEQATEQAATAPPSEEPEKVSMAISGATLTVTSEEQLTDKKLVVAAYNDDNTLKTVRIYDITTDNGAVETDLSEFENDHIKAILIDSFDKINPLCRSLAATILIN
ncbi:MAG: immunoglobulin-like domain-containing protein [Candidatus Ornithomonoglobus sp.]